MASRSTGLWRASAVSIGLAAAGVTGVALVTLAVANPVRQAAGSSSGGTISNPTPAASSSSAHSESSEESGSESREGTHGAPTQQTVVQAAPPKAATHAVTSGS
jgi:hypothetical protein